MTAYDWCALAAVAGLLALAAWYSTGPNDQAAWDASTATRTEDDVQADLAAAREARQLVEQHAFDQTFADIVAAEYPADIPHQTRRTEEDQ